jgi:hypothetical protein
MSKKRRSGFTHNTLSLAGSGLEATSYCEFLRIASWPHIGAIITSLVASRSHQFTEIMAPNTKDMRRPDLSKLLPLSLALPCLFSPRIPQRGDGCLSNGSGACAVYMLLCPYPIGEMTTDLF